MLLKANENVCRLLREVLGRRNRGLNSSFIVRKISSGIGVERTFQLFLISKIEVIRRGDVRRSKLFTCEKDQESRLGLKKTTWKIKG